MIRRALAFALLIACGLGFILYPQATAWYKEREVNKIAFSAAMAAADIKPNNEIINSAEKYNAQLAVKPVGSINPDTYATDQKYQSQLQFGTQAMSEVYIPKIAAQVPIYHGTGAWELAHGAGHLYGSSLPVGGASTHTVVTAHAGVPGNELFTRLAELEIGDEFTIHTSNLRLTYRVNKIQTVLPDEVEPLAVVSDQDLATLVTCTPININTHRLLVTGERVALPVQRIQPPMWGIPRFLLIFVGGTLGALLLGLLVFRKPKPALVVEPVAVAPIPAVEPVETTTRGFEPVAVAPQITAVEPVETPARTSPSWHSEESASEFSARSASVTETPLVEPIPAVEPVETPARTSTSWPSEESASEFSTRSASVTETTPAETTTRWAALMPAVEPVEAPARPAPSWASVESASGLAARSASVTETPLVEPVAVAPLPAPSWPSVESASGFSTRSASVTETPLVEPVETTPTGRHLRRTTGDGV
ncbi:MAG: class C sortase [Cellulomonadaceae bacterium]|jgi:sortase A|nr:class C sortase [Cellulomonadaceae bacterium]